MSSNGLTIVEEEEVIFWFLLVYDEFGESTLKGELEPLRTLPTDSACMDAKQTNSLTPQEQQSVSSPLVE